MALLDWTGRPNPFDGEGGFGSGVAFASGIDVMFWQAQTLGVPAGSRVNALAYAPALGLFCGVGVDPSNVPFICTSPDGATWTAQTNPYTTSGGFALTGIAWSATLGVFVVSGVDNTGTFTIATSADGITWTAQTSPFDATFACGPVAWSPELGLFIVGNSTTGAAPAIMTSPDGTTWTGQATPWDADSPAVNAIAWCPGIGGGLLVAAGSNGSGDIVMTSPDGATWTTRTTAFDGAGAAGQSAAYSPTLLKAFVGGHDNGFTISLIESTNGTAWSAVVPAPFDGGATEALAAGPGGDLFLGGLNASGPGGTVTLARTADGATFAYEAAVTDAAPEDVLALASNGTIIVAGELDAGTRQIQKRAAAASSGVLAVVGQDDAAQASVEISPDGIDWYVRGAPNDLRSGVFVEYSADLALLLLGGSEFPPDVHGSLQITSDGVIWQKVTPADWDSGAVSPAAAAWSTTQAQWVAVASYFYSGAPTSRRAVMTSPDGMNWTAQDSPFDIVVLGDNAASPSGVAYSPDLDLWVAVAPDDVAAAQICTSPDGSVWSAVGGTPPNVFAVAWVAFLGIFVAVGTGGIYTSPDGTTWTAKTSTLGLGQNLYGVADCGDRVVACGGDIVFFPAVTLVESTDGNTWSEDTSSPFLQSAYNVCRADALGKIVAVGFGATT